MGGVDGGGGMGYVCYSENIKSRDITQVYVLDYYEALVLRKLTFSSVLLAQDTPALVELMKNLVLRFQKNLVDDQKFIDELTHINNDLYKSLLPGGVRLPPVTDGDIIIKPDGCEKDQAL